MRYLTSGLWTGRRLLLDDPPDWKSEIETRHEVPVEVEIRLQGFERRVVRSPGRVRVSQTWTISLQGSAFVAARDALQTYQNEPLLVPFFPLIAAPASVSSRVFCSFWLACWPDGSTTVVGSRAAAAGAEALVPLFVGRFREEPKVTLLSSVAAQYQLFVQDNEDSLRVLPGTYPPGPAAGDGSARPVLPGWPNFADGQAAGTSPLPVIWVEHKPSLTQQSGFYPQPAARAYQFAFTFVSPAAAVDWLGFWSDRQGPLGSLWLPSFAADGAGLLADAPAGSTVLQVDLTGAGSSVNRAVALFSAPTLEVQRIASVAGSAITLAAPLTNAWAVQDTLVGFAALARFAPAELAISWTHPSLAAAQINFVELPREYGATAGETATTQGGVGDLLHLYTFERWVDGAIVETRYFTDAADAVPSGGHTFAASSFSHADVVQSLDLEDDQLSIRSRSFPGNPFLDILGAASASDGVWKVEVAQTVAGAAPVVLFYGELLGVSNEGAWLDSSVVRLGGLPERKFPSALIQTACNYALFSRACTVVKADFTFTASIVSASGTAVTVFNLASPVGFAGVTFAGYFTGGTFSAQGQTARIMADVFSGPNRVLTLERELTLTPGPASLLPGCDGAHTTCRAYDPTTNLTGKFHNFPNFGGFPFIPIANPSTGAVSNPAPSAGKK